MKDTDEILTFCCDRCDKQKRVRVPAGTDAVVNPRCCRHHLMRVLTRTTLGGESPPLCHREEVL